MFTIFFNSARPSYLNNNFIYKKKINEHHKHNTRSSRFNYVTPALMTGRS